MIVNLIWQLINWLESAMYNYLRIISERKWCFCTLRNVSIYSTYIYRCIGKFTCLIGTYISFCADFLDVPRCCLRFDHRRVSYNLVETFELNFRFKAISRLAWKSFSRASGSLHLEIGKTEARLRVVLLPHCLYIYAKDIASLNCFTHQFCILTMYIYRSI